VVISWLSPPENDDIIWPDGFAESLGQATSSLRQTASSLDDAASAFRRFGSASKQFEREFNSKWNEVSNVKNEELMEMFCEQINKFIEGDIPAFKPVGPFKGASTLSVKGWRTRAMNGGETLLLTKAKVGKSKKIIFEFDCLAGDTDTTIQVELNNNTAEKHLVDFKETIMMGLNLQCYLSEAVLVSKSNDIRQEKAVVEELNEKRKDNENWGSW